MREASGRFFIDTNIILYALGDDVRKMAVGADLINSSPFISMQVINESTHALMRKRKMPLVEIERLLEEIIRVVHLLEIGMREIRLA